MRKSLLKAIVIIVSLLMIAGCPDPVNVQTPVTTDQPTGVDSGTPANTPAPAATSVSYTVKHMKQDVSGDGYTEDTDSRQTLSGTPGASTAAQAKTFTGFTAQTFSQATIAADGSTIVTINYNRNVHSVSYTATTAGVTVPATASYRFDAQVTVEFPTGISAWSWNGTTYTSTNNTFSMPNSDVVLSEIYTVSASNVAETLQALSSNDEDTPYTLIVSDSADLAAITEAISSSNIYVTLSLEGCEGLTSLPDNAFQNCDNLTSIVIPETVTSVGSNVFSGCTNLESVTFAGDVDSSVVTSIIEALPSGAVIEAADTDALDSIIEGMNASSSNVSLSLEHCDGLTSLDDGLFQGCDNLVSIALPDNLESIGDNAFNGCTGLENIAIPETVTSVGTGVFTDCSNLESVTFSGDIASSVVTDIIGALPSGAVIEAADTDALDSIIEGMNASSSNVSLSLEHCDGLTSLDDGLFQGCDNLVSITLPDNLESIGDNAFNGCTGLENIAIPETVSSVGTGVFTGCSNIESVTLPGTLDQTSIQNAISSLPSNSANSSYDIEITNVTTTTQISDIKTAISNSGKYVDLSLENCTGLTSLPNEAFIGCTKLTSIELPSSVTSIGSQAFYGCSSLESITIPSFVTSIGSHAFSYCHSLESISIPASVTSFGSCMFYYCDSLESITILSSVTSIGGCAFEGCIRLESITIPSSVTSIGDYAFSGCTSLESISIPSSSSVTSIGNCAFNCCTSLPSISIPSSVTSIGNYAFNGCTSLQTITFQGTTSQWNSISKGSLWNDGCPATMQIVCTNGTVTP